MQGGVRCAAELKTKAAWVLDETGLRSVRVVKSVCRSSTAVGSRVPPLMHMHSGTLDPRGAVRVMGGTGAAGEELPGTWHQGCMPGFAVFYSTASQPYPCPGFVIAICIDNK